MLSHLTRRGSPHIVREIVEGKSKPFSFSGMQKIVQRMRKDIGLPAEFTLDACRHGGMTELEEAELTEGQVRARSAHRTKRATLVMPSVRRPACSLPPGNDTLTGWRNQAATSIQNEPGEPFRMKKVKVKGVPENASR
jgi:hypothetical protein